MDKDMQVQKFEYDVILNQVETYDLLKPASNTITFNF